MTNLGCGVIINKAFIYLERDRDRESKGEVYFISFLM